MVDMDKLATINVSSVVPMKNLIAVRSNLFMQYVFLQLGRVENCYKPQIDLKLA